MLRRTPFGVRWKPNEEAEPILLSELEFEKGNWQISPLYIQIATAKEWQMTPYEFFDLPYGERLLMVGYDLVEKKMAAYEQQYAERQAKLNSHVK